MRILYHPKIKVRLGFETYCAPDNFDRHAQPVDIYEVFKAYFASNKRAKFIYSVDDSIPAYTVLKADEMPLAGAVSPYGGFGASTNFLCSYELGGVRYNETYGIAAMNGDHAAGNYNTLNIVDTSMLPDPAVSGHSEKIFVQESRNYAETGRVWEYDSKDATHLYWSGAAQYFIYTSDGGIVQPIIKWKGVKRYVITSADSTTARVCDIGNIKGPVWLYCGSLISAIRISNSNATTSTIKYIHCDKLSSITRYIYCSHYGSLLTGDLYISPGATEIGDSADSYKGSMSFRSSLNITSITIPDSIITIHDASFMGNTGLTKVVLGNNVINIGYAGGYGSGAFQNCTNLAEIDLKNVQNIGYQSFYNCVKLINTELLLPESVISIGYLAFYNCKFGGAVGHILNIPENVTSIGYGAFAMCEFDSIVSNADNFIVDKNGGDTDILYEQTGSIMEANYSAKSGAGTLVFRDDATKIMRYCSYSNTAKTGSLAIPSTVTIIDDYAFYSCTGLTGNIVVPNAVTVIGAQTFRACSGFNGTISLGSGLLTIGEFAFRSCGNITGNLVIPDSTSIIGQYAFEACGKLTGTLTIGSTVETIGIYAFAFPFTGTLDIPASVTTLGEAAFAWNNCTLITSSATNYIVTDKVLYDIKTSGKIMAKSYPNALAGSLTLRADTTSILTFCFYGSQLSGSITIPSTVAEIKVLAFYACDGFWDSLIINNPTIVIAAGAFGTGNIGRTSGGVQLPANYASAYNTWNFSNYLSAVTMNQSLLNITDGITTAWKTFTIGATNKARLLAAYPTAETDANARFIYVV